MVLEELAGEITQEFLMLGSMVGPSILGGGVSGVSELYVAVLGCQVVPEGY